MDIPFPGQRWISTTQPELGLGLVLEADISRVRLLFPATGEMRTYAWGNAPLSRYTRTVGDRVTDEKGDSFEVENVTNSDGCCIYHGEGKMLPESCLADIIFSSGPLDRLLEGGSGEGADFDFRQRLLEKCRERAGHPVEGLLGGRISWLPHQISIVHEVCQRIHPRVLLADEVGLGKTIEAGLILHHALVTGRAQRILVVVPEALIYQWFVEMLRRFHLTFLIMDDERFSGAGEDNPFFDAQCVLCSLDALTDSTKALALAEAGEWDLLVVDEAHHLAWSPESSSPEYHVVASLAALTPGVLLLTATPAQQGDETHFAQLQLLDSDRYRSLDAFREEQLAYVQVANEAERLMNAGETEALTQLLTCHGPGRISFRNTREVVSGFPKRIPHPIYVESDKLDWLRSFLEQHPQEKVLVMTRRPDQVKTICEGLQGCVEPPPVLFHEGQHLLERDRQAAWFADENGARVMIASDIGGEGRNFQFVRHLVLFDLPRDPERIEQRIGRLDRMGQQAEFHIHIPVVQGSQEADWLRWVDEGLGALTHPISCGQRCLEEFKERLDQVDEALLEDTRARVKQLEQENRLGPQRLLALKHSLDQPDVSLMNRLKKSDLDENLYPFAEELWGKIGLEVESLRDAEWHLKSGPFDKGDVPLREGGIRFTTDRSVALLREDLELLTWDHPLIREGWDAILQSALGTAVCLASPEIEHPMLQCLFVLEAVAPPAWHISRYLPPTPLLVTVDALGREADAPSERVVAKDAQILLSHTVFRKEWLPDRMEDATRKAGGKSKRLLKKALASARDQLDQELQRLEDLKQINDHVREDEIIQLRQQKENIEGALARALPRLDAVRLFLPVRE